VICALLRDSPSTGKGHCESAPDATRQRI
jgi:hypothetical protein